MQYRPLPIRRVDVDSGLVYNETTLPAIGASKHLNWQHKCKGSLNQVRNRNDSETGARSLLNTVIKRLAHLLPYLESAHFRGMAWEQVKPLWDYLSKRELVSLHAWKVLALAFPREDVSRHFEIDAWMFFAPGTWTTALNVANSAKFEFITLLEIANMRATRLDLLNLPEIANLGSLKIGPGLKVTDENAREQDGIDNALLRAWARSSQERGTYSVLRRLHLSSQNLLTCRRAVEWAAAFPRLASFFIVGTYLDVNPGDRANFESLGWQLVHEDADSKWSDDRGEDKISNEARTILSGHSLYNLKNEEAEGEGARGLPRMHVRIIGPNIRLYSHRIRINYQLQLWRDELPEHHPKLDFELGAVNDDSQVDETRKRKSPRLAKKKLKAGVTKNSKETLASFGI